MTTSTTDAAPVPAGRSWPTVAFAVLAALAAALLVWLTRHQTFIQDEWAFLQYRYSGGLPSLLRAHNSHVMALPLLAYKILFHTVGLHTRWPYVLTLAVAHVAVVTGVFVLVRRRIGDAAALALVVPLLLLGAAWEDLLWPASLNFVLVTLGAVIAWLGLDRRDARGDLVALAGALVMVASSTACVAFLAALGAELLLTRRRRSLWVVAIPLVLFVAWGLRYGTSDVTLDAVIATPRWAANAAAAAVGGYAGLTVEWGRALLVLAVAGAAAWCLRHPGRADPRAWSLLIAATGFWLLTGIGRALVVDPGTASRYVYVGAVLLVLLGAELLRDVRPARAALWGLAAFAVFALLAGADGLRVGDHALQSASDELRARTGALELVASAAPADYAVAPGLAPIVAGPYLAVVGRAGSSPADSPAELLRAPAAARSAADAVLSDLAASITPAAGAAARCGPAAGAAEVAVPAGSAAVVAGAAGAEVRLRRFGDAWPQAARATLPASGGLHVAFAPDRSPAPWHVQVTGGGPVRACAAG